MQRSQIFDANWSNLWWKEVKSLMQRSQIFDAKESNLWCKGVKSLMEQSYIFDAKYSHIFWRSSSLNIQSTSKTAKLNRMRSKLSCLTKDLAVELWEWLKFTIENDAPNMDAVCQRGKRREVKGDGNCMGFAEWWVQWDKYLRAF